jgi:hypothetical protein
VKNVMATNSLIYVELLKSRHINAVETRMNSGFEARGSAWEASALPLSYTRMRGFYASFRLFSNRLGLTVGVVMVPLERQLPTYSVEKVIEQH